jgi:hypothetical protein
MYSRNSLILLCAVFITSFHQSTAQKSCLDGINALQKKFEEMVLTKDQLTDDQPIPIFSAAKEQAIKEIIKIQNCGLEPRHQGLLMVLSDMKAALEAIEETTSKGDATRQKYEKFILVREKFFRVVMGFQTEILLDTVRARMDRMILGTQRQLEQTIKPLSSISGVVNKEVKHRTDSIADTLDTRSARRMNALGNRIGSLERQFSSSPLYMGINWFTQSGLGFGMHYHFNHQGNLSLLTGVTLLYQWRPPAHDQDTAHNDFGVTLSGGFSVPLSPHNRLGLMLDLAMINEEVKVGGRLMAYNRNFAVGMGYNEYMGADVTLMIRFHDPKR